MSGTPDQSDRESPVARSSLLSHAVKKTLWNRHKVHTADSDMDESN